MHRFLIKFKVIGEVGMFWSEYRVWDIDQKSLRDIHSAAIFQAKEDASSKLKKSIKEDDIDVISFNLIDFVR